jgi:hypothetical protein
MSKTKMHPVSSLRFDHGVIGNWNFFSYFYLFTFAFFAYSPQKAGPPHLAGGVFFLGRSYDYIKGGEMERLINFCMVGFFIFFFRRFSFFFFIAGVILIIGDVPALAFELERTQRDYFFGFALAINAFGNGWGRDALQGFKSFPAF